jgi:hypothetical protein
LEITLEKRSRHLALRAEQIDIRVGRAMTNLGFWAGRDNEFPLDETFPLDELAQAAAVRLKAAMTG